MPTIGNLQEVVKARTDAWFPLYYNSDVCKLVIELPKGEFSFRLLWFALLISPKQINTMPPTSLWKIYPLPVTGHREKFITI